LKQFLTQNAPLRRAEAAVLMLQVPPEISQNLTHFTDDPRHMLVHRDKLARMIETLRRER
jgi:hypothetical protein